jgi:PAS domain S-box-containing protein
MQINPGNFSLSRPFPAMNTESIPPADPAYPGPDAHQALLHLRERAEKSRRLVTQATSQSTPEEVQRLVQELQVHQIELEMQYEELLQAQTEVATARTQYIDLYEFAPVGYFTLSEAGLIEQLNLRASQLMGGSRQRLISRRFALFVDPESRIEFGQFLSRILRSEHSQSIELPMRRDDGTLFYALLEGLHAAASPHDAGAGQRCRLALLDVTTRRRAADALTASEARFRSVFEQSPDGMVLLSNVHVASGNAAALRQLGLHHCDELRGRDFLSFWPEFQPDGSRTYTAFSECVSTATTHGYCRLEWTRPGPDGQPVWDELSFNPVEVEGYPLMHVALRDITAQHLANEQLHESEERLQLALHASGSGVWFWEIGPDRLYWDARSQAIVTPSGGPAPASFAELQQCIPPDDFAELQAALHRALQQHSTFDVEHRIRLADGSIRYVAALANISYDDRNQPQRLTGVIHDITARRRDQEQLRREKEFSDSLLQHSIDGVVALDRDLRLTAWNAEATRFTGQEAAAVLGQPVFELVPALDTEANRQALARALSGEQVAMLGLPFRSRAGHYDIFLVPLRGPDVEVTGVLCIIRDVTERDRLAEVATQSRLRQQQEVLSAILETQETERKRIAEALHNGLGQLLYATKLSLEGRNGTPGTPADALKLLNESIRATRTISFELTPGILEDFGLRIALEELVKRISPRHLPVRLHLQGLEQPLPASVEIAVYRITQELLNNVLKHAQATEVLIHIIHENDRLEVTVEDNGRGFESAKLASQPLTGIGLSGVRNRVLLLGGTFSLNSKPGRGTIASIELTL